MKRSEFLASIPALASIPFIGEDIIRDGSKIILLDPKPIETVREIPWTCHDHPYISEGKIGQCGVDPNVDRVQFLMMVDGHIVGSASMNHIGVGEGYIDDVSIGMDSYRYSRPRLEVRATFDHDKVMEHWRKQFEKL